MIDQDLLDLLAAWLGGDDPGETRREELLARLRSDPEFRAAAVAELRMLGMLRAVQSAEPRWLLLSEALGTAAKNEPSEVDDLANRVVQLATARRNRYVMIRRVTAALIVVILVVLGVALFRTPHAPIPEPHGPDLARATHLNAVEWEPGQRPVADGGGVAAGPLRVRSGEFVLAFPSGVVLAVEGPADLDVVDRNRVYCRRGKFRARTPIGAEGFTVASAGCEVVDLGTEFGLNVAPGEKSRLMVFEGQAAVSVVDADGRSLRSEMVEGPRAVEVDAGAPNIQDVALEPDQFIRLPTSMPQSLTLSPDYRTTVMAAGPWGYWRFDRMNDERVPNEIAGRPPLRAEGGLRLGGTPGGNSWAVFRGDQPGQVFICEGDWTPPRVGGYALEVWVQANPGGETTPAQMAPVSVVTRDESPYRQHLSLLELNGHNRSFPSDPCAVRFLDRWPAGDKGGVDVFSRRTVAPTVWHHLVGQKTRDTVELYIDGELAGTGPAKLNAADPAAATAPCQILVGRVRLRPAGQTPFQAREFRGRIDELAVYDRPLTAAEIRAHASRGH